MRDFLARLFTKRSPPPRGRWRRWLVEAAIVLAVVGGVQAWRSRDVPQGAAPAFAATLADGSALSLGAWRARHPGRAVALHFWAEWCPICRAEEGSVESLRADWPVLTVAMQSGDAAAVRRTLRERGLDWPTAVDAGGGIAARFGVRGVPAFIVVDPHGRIRFAEIGYTTEIGMRLRLWWAQR